MARRSTTCNAPTRATESDRVRGASVRVIHTRRARSGCSGSVTDCWTKPTTCRRRGRVTGCSRPWPGGTAESGPGQRAWRVPPFLTVAVGPGLGPTGRPERRLRAGEPGVTKASESPGALVPSAPPGEGHDLVAPSPASGEEQSGPDRGRGEVVCVRTDLEGRVDRSRAGVQGKQGAPPDRPDLAPGDDRRPGSLGVRCLPEHGEGPPSDTHGFDPGAARQVDHEAFHGGAAARRPAVADRQRRELSSRATEGGRVEQVRGAGLARLHGPVAAYEGGCGRAEVEVVSV